MGSEMCIRDRFNKLTNHQVYAADQLFATLDTTTRLLSTDGSEDSGK